MQFISRLPVIPGSSQIIPVYPQKNSRLACHGNGLATLGFGLLFRAVLGPQNREIEKIRGYFPVEREFRDPSAPRAGRRVAAGDAAEDGARHQARAARVVVVVEAADDLARGVEAGDRVA